MALSKARLERLHAVMSRHVERGGVPGLVALVSRHDELHVDAIGLPRDTIFRIASMTKPVTAVATLMLVEECTLRLDDPVDGWLPELASRRVLRSLDAQVDDTVPASRPITVRDLLTFTAGFGMVTAAPGTYPIQAAIDAQGFAPGPLRPAHDPPPDEWMRRLGALPLVYQPGARWMYHTGSDVLGVLIARAAGQPFESFLRERIFEPLGMKDTAFSVPADKLDRFATSHWTNFATGVAEVYDRPDGQWSRPPAFPSGGGGLVSTADDYLAFARMLLSGGRDGGERLLSRHSVETMTTDQLTPAQKQGADMTEGEFESLGWGFGVSVVTRRRDPSAPVGQYGWDGGLGTSFRIDPSEGLVGILLTQQAFTSPSPPAVCRDFWTSVYQAIDD